MMNMQPKAVAQDAGNLLALIDAILDPAKAQGILQGMAQAAQVASEAMDKMVEERKVLDAQHKHLDELEVKLAALQVKLEREEAELQARMDAQRQREEDHATRVKRLREVVG